MYEYLKVLLDSRITCLVTRPFAAMVAAGVGGGIFGAWGGVVYGALNGSLTFVTEGTLRGALAGAVAGFMAGLASGLDRTSWPEAPRKGSVPRTVRVAPVVIVAEPRTTRFVVRAAS